MISRLIIAGLLIATVGLTGCGKKGPLEPPKAVRSIILAH